MFSRYFFRAISLMCIVRLSATWAAHSFPLFSLKTLKYEMFWKSGCFHESSKLDRYICANEEKILPRLPAGAREERLRTTIFCPFFLGPLDADADLPVCPLFFVPSRVFFSRIGLVSVTHANGIGNSSHMVSSFLPSFSDLRQRCYSCKWVLLRLEVRLSVIRGICR